MANKNNNEKALEQDNENLANDNNALNEEIAKLNNELNLARQQKAQARALVGQLNQIFGFVSQQVNKIDEDMKSAKTYDAGFEVHSVLQTIGNNQQKLTEILNQWENEGQ